MMDRESQIIERLRKEYKDTTTALNFRNPYELLVATILAAQCTDKRVNMITGALFEK
jgi:endonuclease-3